MEGQEYLDQISATTLPTKSKGNFFKNKFFIIGTIAVTALLLFAVIIVALLGDDKTSEKSVSFALKLHLDYTESTIKEYQPSVKSSILRGYSASLSSVLSNTNSTLTSYITDKYKFKPKSVSKKTVAAAEKASKELKDTLFEAKINGILDRIYTHKMIYETSSLMTEINKVIKATKNDGLKEALTSSYASIENLHTQFSNYSETRKE